MEDYELTTNLYLKQNKNLLNSRSLQLVLYQNKIKNK